MKIQYDREADVLSILLSETPVEESDEDKPGVILDYDKAWYLVGVGILDAAKHIGNPMSAEYPTPLLVERVREALGRSAFSLALSRSASTAPASFLRRSSDCLEAPSTAVEWARAPICPPVRLTPLRMPAKENGQAARIVLDMRHGARYGAR